MAGCLAGCLAEGDDLLHFWIITRYCFAHRAFSRETHVAGFSPSHALRARHLFTAPGSPNQDYDYDKILRSLEQGTAKENRVAQ